jgi:hypothetical protein
MKRYSSTDGTVFELLETWTQDDDTWVKYQNAKTGQEYSCREEAFLNRFYIILD